jgi:PIN domain nuclease of toxin-antitoxin system
MQLLVDTHAFIWFAQGDQRLPLHACGRLENMRNVAFISVATTWEIAAKASPNKRQPGEPLSPWLDRAFDARGVLRVWHDAQAH